MLNGSEDFIIGVMYLVVLSMWNFIEFCINLLDMIEMVWGMFWMDIVMCEVERVCWDW